MGFVLPLQNLERQLRMWLLLVSLSSGHPLMTSAEDSGRGAPCPPVTKPHTYTGNNGSGKHLCIKNK